MRQTIVLVVLDGWGIGGMDESNAIYMANPETMNYIQSNFPSGALQASGIAVGLPWEEEGNSEVGHLTIGAGRVLYQHFPKISMAIDDRSFFGNIALKSAFAHAQKNDSSVHFVGLLTDGNVHSSFKHLTALLEMAKLENCKALYLHLFSDGRDSAPRSAEMLFGRLHEEIKKNGLGEVASLNGRYYGMDRDRHWERTEAAYKVLINEGGKPKTLNEVLEKTYGNGLSDEYIEPVSLANHPIKDNDAVIFFNFREDRMRQLSGAFLNPNFDKFAVKKLSNLFIATMTQYEYGGNSKTAAVAFPNEATGKPLGKVLTDNGKNQLRIAETEKYAHVTYFFNGLREEAFPNEYRVLIPSRVLVHPETNPEMMARAITDRALAALGEGSFDFILLNYANPDIIAHTGNYEAVLKAVKIIDVEIGRLFRTVIEQNHVLIITSDHGNAESVLNLRTGEPETKHDPSPVPFYLVSNEFKKKDVKVFSYHLPIIGMLSDMAPTILALMKIKKPEEMTGENLLGQLLGV